MCRIFASRSGHTGGEMAVEEALQAALASTEPDTQPTIARRRPQRNPAFSTTSRLIVLRDPPAPAAPPAAECVSTDPPTPPPLDTDSRAYTPQNARHFSQHDLVLSAYESRSHWHKQRTRGEPPTQFPTSPAQADASPPSFFSDMFPERARPRWHEASRAMPPAHPTAAVPRPASPVAEHEPAPASPASLRSLSPECESPPAPEARDTARRVAARIDIRGWRRVGTPTHGWVVYDVHVKTPSVRIRI